MAIAKMTHLRLIGMRTEKNKILDVLTKRGLFEARYAECDAIAESGRDETETLTELKVKQSRISFALDFIKARHDAMKVMLSANKKAFKKGLVDHEYDYALSKTKFSSARKLITREQFDEAIKNEYDLMHVCETLQKLSFDIIDCKTRSVNADKTAAEYAPYALFPLPFSALRGSGRIRMALYTGKVSGDVFAELPCAYEKFSDSLYAVVCQDRDFDVIDKAATAAGFVSCSLADDCTAKQKLDAVAAEKVDIERSVYELTKDALDYEKYYDELCVLYDVIELRIERAEAEDKFKTTDSTFVLEGWIPEKYAKDVANEIGAVCPDAFMQLLAAEERDAPPTLVVSKKVLEPYEDVTNMYSAPKYGEIDPNPVMSIFFFLFFGLMVGDAAYGVILAALGLGLGFSKKFDVGMRRMLQLVGWGGVAAIFWGVLFGSYFGIDFGDTQVAIWFNPMQDPMTMLYLSIALGVLQLTVGYIMQFVKLCKEGTPWSAIFDAGPIILLFAALTCLAVSMITPGMIPKFDFVISESGKKGLTIAAIVLAATGVAIMIIFGGRKNKNVFGKIFGGFKGLYGLINLLSDLLSYCRLFGLALSSCAIALAFNTLGLTFGAAGYVLLVVLHVFNMALAVLSAYVHDVRLQVLEFYGKFYEGEGRLFTPLGRRTKKIRFG